MAPMPDPRDRIPGFRERHPRVASALYQIGLCVMTFFLAITIGRYGPESEVPGSVEQMCPNGAREDEFELGFLDVVMPHFMACPSTTTFIAAIILFLTGIIRLNYHNREDVWLPLFMMWMFMTITISIEWKRFFALLQMRAPFQIWTISTLSALMHPIFRWALPGFYTRAVEAREKAREEARLKKMQEDLERGIRQPGEPREVTELGVGVDEDTPLTGRGFSRMNSGACVESPSYGEEGALRSS